VLYIFNLCCQDNEIIEKEYVLMNEKYKHQAIEIDDFG